VLEQLQPYLPLAAIVGGVLVILWGEKDRLTTVLGQFRPAAKAEPVLGPHDLFERLYDLRTWCEATGRTEAVKALDENVLPAIVRGVDGGPKP
jgi:hypothetical protein